MEALLFTLDVFFMFLLLVQVCRAERGAAKKNDLGLFAYRERDDDA